MPRVARIVVPGAVHHITQRGNNCQDVFFTEDDRRLYLNILVKSAGRFGLRIWGYCLMTNHVHVVAIPEREESLAKAIGRANFAYTQYVNDTHRRSGHLWQNRFYSCAMDGQHAANALCYADLNPVRARMAAQAWDYPWSSAAAHCGLSADHRVLHPSWRELMAERDYQAVLERVRSATSIQDEIRRSTLTGRPLGSDSFLERVEKALGRRVRPLPVGRPRPKRRSK